MYECIRAEWVDQTARLTLDRPQKRNALTRQMIGEIVDFLKSVHAREDARLLTIQAEGKVFCAGMDLSEMRGRAQSDQPEVEWSADAEIYQRMIEELLRLSIPTVVFLQGPVLAGGVGLVLACDMQIASESCFFQLPEPRRGIVAAMVTPLLVYRTSVATASYLLLSGKRVVADEAQRLGLVQQVVCDEDFSAAQTEFCASVLTGSQAALALTKKHLRSVVPTNLIAGLQRSTDVSADARRSADAAEGLAAFLENRDPQWIVKQD